MSLINNTKWVALAQITKVLCQIISLVVLARLIPPAEYGLMAMAGVIVALGFLFRDMGTSAALIQKKDLTEELKNAVFWLNIIIGFVVAIAIICASSFAATYFSQPDLVCVLILLSLSFPITSSSSSHLALMERKSEFKKIAFIESACSLIATFLAILTAYQGWGVYSLVVQSLVNAFLSTIMIVYASKWLPSWYGYKYLKEIKEIFGFSGNLVAFNFVNYFSRNADRWIIGKFMPSAVLGAYDLGYRIMLFPLQTLTFVMSRSTLPILSQMQDSLSEFNEAYLKSLKYITFFSLPMMCGLMILREPFVYYLFGGKWSLIPSILYWLAPTGILQSINSTTGAIFTAKGKTKLLFYTGVMCAFIYMVAFISAANKSIEIFSQYYFFANIIAVSMNMLIVFKMIRLSWVRLVRVLLPNIISTGVMVLFLLLAMKILDSSVVVFLSIIFLSALIYFLTQSIFLMKKIRVIFS